MVLAPSYTKHPATHLIVRSSTSRERLFPEKGHSFVNMIFECSYRSRNGVAGATSTSFELDFHYNVIYSGTEIYFS